MSLMKFVSEPEKAVYDALCGLKHSYPSLTVDPDRRIVISNQIQENKVCLLSGGGSGHEPFAAGYVGSGMLSGVTAGLVFASPPTETILTTIRTLAENNKNTGVLVIIMNYTGDILNFGLAIEEAKATGIKVENVVVSEDCSRTGDEVQGAGRRGMCGTCIVIKIAGSMAACGQSLSEIASECRLINESMCTLGTAVSPCTVPGVGPLFKIPSDEVDIGLGIHGEAGVSRIKIPSIDELLEIMLGKIVASLNLKAGFEVCVLINNLGSVSQLEIGIICGKIHSSLSKKSIKTLRMYSGLFMTSLDMAGFQICILNVTGHKSWIDHLDSATDAPAWTGTCISRALIDTKEEIKIHADGREKISKAGPMISLEEATVFENCLRSIASAFVKEEARLNELDSMVGDGDAGATLKRLADSILQSISTLELQYPATCFHQLAKLSLNVMGGSSGALYGIFLTSAFTFLSPLTSLNWVDTWRAALSTLQVYSKAKVGDRTMMDVLIPACEEFDKQAKEKKSLVEALSESVKVARIKCEETRYMKPRLGRASYVPSEYIKDVDAGAYGIMLSLEAILKTIKSSS